VKRSVLPAGSFVRRTVNFGQKSCVKKCLHFFAHYAIIGKDFAFGAPARRFCGVRNTERYRSGHNGADSKSKDFDSKSTLKQQN
jgi:hypothetical protein